jgi:putative transposase
VDFVRRWSGKAEIGVGRFIPWLGVTASKFYDWRQRYGCVNEHNGWVPRDFWLEPWEKEAIIEFHLKNPLEGYRRLTFVMLDADVVAVPAAEIDMHSEVLSAVATAVGAEFIHLYESKFL